MTAIIGLEHDGKVYIGADSAAVSKEQYIIDICAEKKIFKNKNFIFGGAGSFRLMQITQYTFDPPFHKKHLSDMKYLCGPFIKQFMKTVDEDQYELNGQLLMGYKGKLYCIQNDFHISSLAESFCSIGIGSQFAIGAMASNVGIKDPKERILQALKVSEKFCAGVCGPFHVMSV